MMETVSAFSAFNYILNLTRRRIDYLVSSEGSQIDASGIKIISIPYRIPTPTNNGTSLNALAGFSWITLALV